jgi:hypothetical protein
MNMSNFDNYVTTLTELASRCLFNSNSAAEREIKKIDSEITYLYGEDTLEQIKSRVRDNISRVFG